MVNYKDLGLVNTREMFKKAINGGFDHSSFFLTEEIQLQQHGADAGYHSSSRRDQVSGDSSGF